MSLAHKDDQYETPTWLFDQIRVITGLQFNLDVCADLKNTKCEYYIKEESNALTTDWNFYSSCRNKVGTMEELDLKLKETPIVFCNPPRSINGNFVDKAYQQWKDHNIDIVMLLCWNDLGNKYGEKLIPHIMDKSIIVSNLGKVKFNKNGKTSKYVSRLTYFWAWFKSSDKLK